MKNNFITKIIGATLAFAMMIGGAVGINNVQEAKPVNADSETFVKTDFADLRSGDVIVIVRENSPKRAMSNDKGTSAAPTAASITVTNNTITDPASNLIWTFNKSGNDYSFQAGESGDNYLYCTSTNNGVRVGTNSNKTFAMDTSGYLKNGATSRYVGVYSDSDWRCYTSNGGNIANQTFGFYKKQVAQTKTLSSIEITTAPTKTKYVPTESFNPAGMAITAHFSDNSTEAVDVNNCTFSPTTITEVGNVTVTYEGKTATQAVTVYGIISVTGVVDGYPTEFEKNSTSLTKDDVLLNVLCDDDETRTIHPTSISYDFSSGGTATVTCEFSYATGTKTATFDVNVVDNGDGTIESPYTVTKAVQLASALASKTYLGTAVYVKGIISSTNEEITVTEQHRANFNITDGTSTIYAYNINDCTKTNENGLTQIDQYYEVVVRGDLQNYSGTYEICYNKNADAVCEIHSSSAPELTSITATINAGVYYAGDHLSASDFTVTGSYTNGKPASAIESGFTWTVNGQADGTLNEGDNVVIVSYQGKTSENLNVTAEHASYADMVRNLTTKTTLSYKFHKEVPSVEETLNRATTGKTGTSYGDWTNSSSSYGITYKGNSAGGNDSIQLRSSNSTSGIVVNANANNREVRKITINWNSNTAAERTVDIYGKNTAYSSAGDLYSNSTKGTSIASVCVDDGAQAVVTVSSSYQYFGIRSNSGALYIDSIVVEWSGDPQFTYSDVSIRFGGLISKTLWNDLDTNEHLISGFGVMITNNDNVAQNETIGEFAEIADPAGDNPDFDNEYVDYYMSKAEMATPVEQGDNYVWNLFHSISAQDLSKVYVAAAYIKVGNEYIFMQQERYSAVTLAADYLDNRGYNDNVASGSLYNLAHLQQA